MSAVIVAYSPSAGGNHLRNILCLSNSFVNSTEFDSTIYDRADQTSGAVHGIDGRNIQKEYLKRVMDNPLNCFALCGHFGELAEHREPLLNIDKKFIIVSIDTVQDRQLLARRQQRMGQQTHPYWLDEEQPFLYRPPMYQSYFATLPSKILTISLYDLWHPTFNNGRVIQCINDFLNINIEITPALRLHEKWWRNNFNFHFSGYEQQVFGYQPQI
jgi:hypothetical protein